MKQPEKAFRKLSGLKFSSLRVEHGAEELFRRLAPDYSPAPGPWFRCA
jgi:hypothetical protein